MAVSALDVILLTPGPRGRIGLPAIWIGPPGCGKTSMIEQGAARHGLPLETVILSIREPTDLGGLPVVTPTGVRLEPPTWAKRLAGCDESGKPDPKAQGVVFTDELSCATPALQAAALRVVCEGVVGDLTLPPGIRILAASNPEELAAGGWSLTAPLANRMLHLDYETPTPEAWAEWLSGDGRADASAPPVLDEAAWHREWAAARTQVAAFIRRMGSKLLDVPKTDAERGRAWGSPRTWELAARALAGARALKASDSVALRLVAAAVGQGAAAEAFEWLRELDLPDPEDVLDGRAEVPLRRPDQTYASLAGVVAAAGNPHAKRAERTVRALEVAAVVASKSADVSAACARAACQSEGLREAYRSVALTARVAKALSGPLRTVADMLRESVP